MAQYFTDDFADFGTDWTQRYNAPATGSWTVTSGDLSYPNGKSGDWSVQSWNDLDSDADRDDVEVLLLLTVPATSSYDAPLCIVRAGGSDEAVNGWCISFLPSSGRLRIKAMNAADAPVIVSSLYDIGAVSGGTDVWVRFRLQNSGSDTNYYASAWTGAIGDEPGSWLISGTYTGGVYTQSAGWIGPSAFGVSNGNLYVLKQFGVGTNGDSAPSAAVGGGTTPVSSDRSLAWTQRSGVQAGQSLAYPVKNAVQQSRALEWAVRQSVDQTLPLTYTLRSGVQSGLPLAYTISASILRQLDLAWSVLNSGTVVSTLPLTWLVRADVQADRPLAWILRSGVQQPHAMAWEILNSGTVVSSLPLAWLMRSGIQQALPIAYPVRNAVLANRAFAYPVLTAAQSNLLIDYLVRAGVQVSFPLTYEVAGTVQNQLPLAWVVFSSRGVPELLCVNVTNAFPDLRVAVKNVTTLGSDC